MWKVYHVPFNAHPEAVSTKPVWKEKFTTTFMSTFIHHYDYHKKDIIISIIKTEAGKKSWEKISSQRSSPRHYNNLCKTRLTEAPFIKEPFKS
jgi:hypothetical protein